MNINLKYYGVAFFFQFWAEPRLSKVADTLSRMVGVMKAHKLSGKTLRYPPLLIDKAQSQLIENTLNSGQPWNFDFLVPRMGIPIMY